MRSGTNARGPSGKWEIKEISIMQYVIMLLLQAFVECMPAHTAENKVTFISPEGNKTNFTIVQLCVVA